MSQEKQDSKPAELDACVEALLAQGYSEDSAWAICQSQMKSKGLFAGEIQGYASVFGNVDKDGEVVDKGAFAHWLELYKSQDLPLLWIHQTQQIPIGITTILKEDDYGLYYEAKIHNTQQGQDLIKAIESGAIDCSSFKYGIVDSYEDDGIPHLSDLALIEISAVTKGLSANPLATLQIKTKEYEDYKIPVDNTVDIFQAELRRFINQFGG